MENVKQKIDKIKEEIESFFGTSLPETAIAKPDTRSLAGLIDHTYLHPTSSLVDIERVCDQALEKDFHAVCIPPRFVGAARKKLEMSGVQIATVIGFPLGYNKSSIKRRETLKAIESGATEIDMVLPLGALIQNNWSVVRKDIQFVVEGAGNIPVKVILETGYLESSHIIAGCFLSLLAKARFVKTSTGFGPRGASYEDIELMHACIGGRLGIKASGGIDTKEKAQAMIDKGATRIGTSHGMDILSEET